jgi:putative transport protein
MLFYVFNLIYVIKPLLPSPLAGEGLTIGKGRGVRRGLTPKPYLHALHPPKEPTMTIFAEAIATLLSNNPLLLLFVVAALGYFIGHIKIAGFSLGIAAVLFVGLAFGALGPDVKLPEIIYLLGLVLFVYTIGLASGPGFFRSLGQRGLRDNALVLAILLLSAGLTVALALVFGLKAPLAAGLFAGSLTNTPALAGILEALKGQGATEVALAAPVVAYSLSYPLGVIVMLLALYGFKRLAGINIKAESAKLPEGQRDGLVHQSIVIDSSLSGQNLLQLAKQRAWSVVFSRIQSASGLALVGPSTVLAAGDVLSVVGTPEQLVQVLPLLGQAAPVALELDRSQLDFRRIMVSARQVAGKTIASLDLPSRFGAIITRVGRGDSDILPSGRLVLELGDRVRVVCPPAQMRAVGSFFGDSLRALSEVDVLTFAVGISLGLLLGSISWPLPSFGGETSSFKLGFAGGPLLVGLILGFVGRSRSMLWQLPYQANLTLRQLGLILFLAGVGTRAGYAFVGAVAAGLPLVLAGAALTAIAALLTLAIGYWLLKIPFPLLAGMLSGLQTQPAVLAFAQEQAENDLPNLGYTSVYPLAMIAKIILAQLLLLLLPK